MLGRNLHFEAIKSDFFLPIFFKDVDPDMTWIPSSAGMVDALQVNSAAIASLWISCFNFQLLVFMGA